MWYLLLGVEFEMSLELQVKVNFPAEENKLVPCLFALEVKYQLLLSGVIISFTSMEIQYNKFLSKGRLRETDNYILIYITI